MSSLKFELVKTMPRQLAPGRFRTRKDAEQALSEIIEDGGRPGEFRIDELANGGFVITVLDDDGSGVAGVISA